MTAAEVETLPVLFVLGSNGDDGHHHKEVIGAYFEEDEKLAKRHCADVASGYGRARFDRVAVEASLQRIVRIDGVAYMLGDPISSTYVNAETRRALALAKLTEEERVLLGIR